MYKGVLFHNYATIYLMEKGLLELRNRERGGSKIDKPFFKKNEEIFEKHLLLWEFITRKKTTLNYGFGLLKFNSFGPPIHTTFYKGRMQFYETDITQQSHVSCKMTLSVIYIPTVCIEKKVYSYYQTEMI